MFQAAIDYPPADRPAYIDAACAGDEALRQRVAELVNAHERAGSFLNDTAHFGAAHLIAAGAPATGNQTLPAFHAGAEFQGTERFEVLRCLGRGGMGVVYEAHDRIRAEIVALKTFHQARAADLFRLKQEFRSLADIAHPNLVALHELVVDERTCFFTMELVRGVDFVRDAMAADASTLSQRGDRIRFRLAQLVDAVAELHRHGKLHRDIKPTNILVTSAGRVVLLDFGIALTLADGETDAGDWLAGTPAYFAPERHRGAAPSRSQDWYSVGVTLYEALTGRLPFAAPAAEADRVQWDGRPTPPNAINADVPDDLNTICLGLLERDPSCRFTAAQIRTALAVSATAVRTPAADEEEPRPFVGRAEQLAILLQAWSDVRDGHPRVLYVHGPSGIGKTALIDRFLQDVYTGGRGLVLRGRCYEHGRPMSPDVVFAGAGCRHTDRPLLRHLRANHLLRSSGSTDRVELYHDRLRETVVALTPPEERQRFHGRMVQALLAARLDDPDALYIHSREAGDRQAASGYAAAAARRAGDALAFDRAAGYYRAALELAPAHRFSPAWKEGLASALANAGRPVASADAYLAAADAEDATRQFDLQRRAAEQFLLAGHIDRGFATMASVLRAVRLRMMNSRHGTVAALAWERARLRWRGLKFVERPATEVRGATLLQIDTCWSVASGLALVDSLRAAYFQTRCLRAALDAGEPYRIARSLATEVAFAATAGGRNRRSTAALARTARSIAERTGHPHAIALNVLALGVAAFMVGEWPRSAQLCRRALGMMRDQTGVIWDAALAERFLIGSLMYEGRIREVTSMTFRLLETARDIGHVYWDTDLRTGQTLVWLAQDKPAEARQQADDAITRWSQEGFHRQHYNHLLAHVQAALYEGDAREAWARFASRQAEIRRSLVRRIQWTRIECSYWRARCALLAARNSRRTDYLSVARQEATRIEREQMAWSDPVASLLRASIAYLDADHVLALRLLIDAITGFDRAGMALHAAVARRRFSELAGDDRARKYRQEAEEWMVQEGIVNPGRISRLIAPGFPDQID